MRKKRTYDLMERFGLTFALDKQLGEYSKGMKQKLALVRAMLHDPPVLLLDEPTSAMDPQSAKLVRDAIVELQRDERTFLITTHNLTKRSSLLTGSPSSGAGASSPTAILRNWRGASSATRGWNCACAVV